jgi:SAM-dependent methyltransferase
MTSADEIRDVQRTTWAGLSAGWEKWDSVIMDQLRPVGAAIIERLDIAEDHQHLDIAAGTGEPGLSIARLFPKGRVVLTDLVAEMLDIAARRARAQGVANIETKVCSADDLPFNDASFDSVSVRFGYMFFPDVAKATAEFVRVLKPGGRLCSSVWVKPEENPWTAIAMQAIATEAVVAPPDRDGPNMFRCAAPGYVSALYEGAGLRDIAEWDVEVELVTRSPEQYWEMISEHVSLAVAALQQVDEPARERIRAHAIAKVSAFEKDGKVRVPGVAHRRNETGRERHPPTRRRAILQRGLADPAIGRSRATTVHPAPARAASTRAAPVRLQARRRRSESSQVISVMVRQLGHLFLQPMIDAMWRQLAEPGTTDADKVRARSSPRATGAVT